LKQYPSIDYNELYKQIDARFKSFLDGLKDSEEEQLNISGNDFIREQIDQLFYNKIGSPPSKSELDSIYEEGKERYSNFYPPGFKDNTAEKKKSPYLCNGLIFKREYGDLIVWKEILKKVEEEQWKYIIFVTDDDKEDWWREEDGKTLSACPQLTEEIFKFGIKCFYMYSSDRFLKFAKQYIPEVDVKEESIGQVEEFIELAREQEAEENKTDILRMLSSRKVNLLVSEWLVDNYSFEEIIVQETGIDIICLTTLDSLDNQLKVGYEVKNSHKFRLSRLGMRNSLNQIVSYIQSSQLDKAYLVIVIPSSDSTTLAIKSFTISLKELMIDTPLTNFTIGLIVGTIINNRIDYPSPSLCFNELARIEP
ncbi:PIN-like domain-containing protein, partial [Pseudanabaena sp. 'Roaring Creek']|uniref:PIN-like domain-containing protein n=1 Tax=Pseudanabaena sp. 'Roaring Creek' TaxID=1681830 RepID=UPI000B085091